MPPLAPLWQHIFKDNDQEHQRQKRPDDTGLRSIAAAYRRSLAKLDRDTTPDLIIAWTSTFSPKVLPQHRFFEYSCADDIKAQFCSNTVLRNLSCV